MKSRFLLLAAGAALAVGIGAGAAHAASEAEIDGLHRACNGGDRAACVRFGSAIHEGRDHDEPDHRTLALQQPAQRAARRAFQLVRADNRNRAERGIGHGLRP